MPLTIIIFGITGDLSKTKLIPALWQLFDQKTLTNATFIGYGRKDISSIEFEQLIQSAAPNATKEFVTRWQYAQGQIDDPQGYKNLAHHVTSEHRLVYLAVGPDLFETIISHATQSQLLQRHAAHKLIIEKPFGTDEASAIALNQYLLANFDEAQLYRIDHYLGKHALRTLAPGSSSSSINVVQTVQEGVEARGSFFDATGIIRDVIQNHLLEVAATVVCRNSNEEPMPANRAHVLKQLTLNHATLEQYQGYQHEPNVAPDSTTETMADITFNYGDQIIQLFAARKWPTAQNEVIHIPNPPVPLSDPADQLLPHAILLHEAIQNEKQWFVSFDEIQAAWKLIDPILKSKLSPR